MPKRTSKNDLNHLILTVYDTAKGELGLRLKHYGWAKAEDRRAKYLRYQQLDPECKFGWREQYESILDENSNLVAWDRDGKID